MVLYAQAGIEQAAITWVGPVLATAGATSAALFAWLTARDKLRYDVKMAVLEQKVEQCEADRRELHVQIKQLDIICGQQQGELDKVNRKVGLPVSPPLPSVTDPPGSARQPRPQPAP